MASVLIWGTNIDNQVEFDAMMAQITGMEHPVSLPHPEIIQYGVEISAFSAARLGHVIGLNIDRPQADFFDWGLGCSGTDQSGDYAAPILDLFREAPGAVTGYAHVFWPTETYVDAANGGWDWENRFLPSYVGEGVICAVGQDLAFPHNPNITANHPILAATDVAMRRIDFLEAIELERDLTSSPLDERWYGMMYKLLSAGLRVSIAAGTDVDCVHQANLPRTYVRIDDGAELDYEQWTRNLALGRVSLAAGGSQFLNLEVNGQAPGSEIALTSPMAEVNVRATYKHKGLSAVSDTVEIIQDGVVVRSFNFGPLSDGRRVFDVNLPVSRSGWIAARTRSNSAHTGATYLVLDKKPTANCVEAEYWMLYQDHATWLFDSLTLNGYLGCSGTEIRQYLTEGRKVFTALRDYDRPLPDQVTRFGISSPPECTPPIGIVTSSPPTIGTQMSFRCFNAPSSAAGWLLLSSGQDVAGTPYAGSMLHVDLTSSISMALPVIANKAGYAETSPPPIPNFPGFTGYGQFLWINPADCRQTGLLSSSEALSFTMTP